MEIYTEAEIDKVIEYYSKKKWEDVPSDILLIGLPVS